MDGCPESNLSSDTIPPPAPQLLTPSGIIDYNNPQFEWKAVTDPSDVTYSFSLLRVSDNQYLFHKVITESPFFDPQWNLGNDKYVWYITAIDGAGNESTTNSMEFTIKADPIIE
jgi:hypothetical protein